MQDTASLPSHSQEPLPISVQPLRPGIGTPSCASLEQTSNNCCVQIIDT